MPGEITIQNAAAGIWLSVLLDLSFSHVQVTIFPLQDSTLEQSRSQMTSDSARMENVVVHHRPTAPVISLHMCYALAHPQTKYKHADAGSGTGRDKAKHCSNLQCEYRTRSY